MQLCLTHHYAHTVSGGQSQLTKSNGSIIYSRTAQKCTNQTLSRLRATKAQLYYDEIFLIIQNFTEIINNNFHGKVSK